MKYLRKPSTYLMVVPYCTKCRGLWDKKSKIYANIITCISRSEMVIMQLLFLMAVTWVCPRKTQHTSDETKENPG